MKTSIVIGLLACLTTGSFAVPQRFRQGREKLPDQGYLAPVQEEYGAPSEEAPDLYASPVDEEPVALPSEVDNSYLAPEASEVDNSYLSPAESAEEPLDSYAADEGLGTYNDLDAAGSELLDEAADPLKMLMNAVPGVPGEDYPIYAEVPETAFSCDSAIDGGYYADDEAECQVFHICTADGAGGLAKYSFLCPNGTIFNQNYFICDWWFNFDCSEAAAIAEAKNSELAAAREAAAAAIPADEAASASESEASYAAPAVEGGYLAPNEEYDDYEEENQAAYGDSQSSYTQRRRS